MFTRRKVLIVTLLLTMLPVYLLARGADELTRKGQEQIAGLDEKGRSKQRDILRKFSDFSKKVEQMGGPASGSFFFPVESGDVTGLTAHDRPPGISELPTVFAYLKRDASYYPEASEKETLGTLQKGERVEVTIQLDRDRSVARAESWSLIRTTSGKEGYVKSANLSSEKPGPGKEGADFVMPVEGRKTSGFGPRIDPVTGKRGSFHAGIDIACPTGTPIHAAMAGVVKKTMVSKSYGNLMILDHGNDLVTYYAHQSRFAASQGQRVKKGELIGYVGTTGKSTGPHLHFEVRKDGEAMDPAKFVPD